MRAALLVLFVGVPAGDLAITVVAVGEVGFLRVLLYLFLATVAGVLCLRYAGPIALARASRRLGQGETPGREIVDGLLMFAGGLYFVFPGPLSDVVAVFFVTPFLRRAPRALLLRAFRRRGPATPEDGPLDVEDYSIR